VISLTVSNMETCCKPFSTQKHLFALMLHALAPVSMNLCLI